MVQQEWQNENVRMQGNTPLPTITQAKDACENAIEAVEYIYSIEAQLPDEVHDTVVRTLSDLRSLNRKLRQGSEISGGSGGNQGGRGNFSRFTPTQQSTRQF